MHHTIRTRSHWCCGIWKTGECMSGLAFKDGGDCWGHIQITAVGM